jgi:hypothetical protein
VIPVEVTQTPWHYTTFRDWLDHWQTLIAGFLAFMAGVGTVVAAIWAIWATRSTARKQIDASGEDARKVIAATRDLTEATFKQTETTVRLEETRNRSQALAFRVMLKAAMTRVIAEAQRTRETFAFTFTAGGSASREAFAIRNCITKGGFAELRTACVRQGSPLTGKFPDLECEVDNFALQCGTYALSAAAPMPVRKGVHAGLGEQPHVIETMAKELRQNAAQDSHGIVWPCRAGAS